MPAKRVAQRVTKRPATAKAEAVAAQSVGVEPLTTTELRGTMRNKLEAILPALETAVRRGQIDVLDYAHFLAKYGLGERSGPPVRVKNAVVLLPPRNSVATNSQEIAVAEVVHVR